MSRLRYLAKIIVKFPKIVSVIRALWVQISLYADSFNHMEFQEQVINSTMELEDVKLRVENYNNLLKILFLLRPKKINPDSMIRVGPRGEGGYVIYNNLEKISKILSIGVAKDTAFEEDFSRRVNGKVSVELYDHTDRPLRKLPSNFRFYSLGIGDSDDYDKHLLTFSTIIQNSIKLSDTAMLKIDIDGAEYFALNQVENYLYNKFDQIILELHEISQKNISNGKILSILNKILDNFYVVHLHPNSYAPWNIVYGVCLPQVLEITLINKKYSKLFSSDLAVFPTPLDYPNQMNKEMVLGAFIYPEPKY